MIDSRPLADRVADLEDLLRNGVGDLTLAQLQRKMLSDWQPDAGTLLQARSITPDLLTRPYSMGTATLNFAANNDATSAAIPHGLAGTPTIVIPAPRNAGTSAIAAPACVSRDATNLTFSACTYNRANATMTVTLDWFAAL